MLPATLSKFYNHLLKLKGHHRKHKTKLVDAGGKEVAQAYTMTVTTKKVLDAKARLRQNLGSDINVWYMALCKAKNACAGVSRIHEARQKNIPVGGGSGSGIVPRSCTFGSFHLPLAVITTCLFHSFDYQPYIDTGDVAQAFGLPRKQTFITLMDYAPEEYLLCLDFARRLRDGYDGKCMGLAVKYGNKGAKIGNYYREPEPKRAFRFDELKTMLKNDLGMMPSESYVLLCLLSPVGRRMFLPRGSLDWLDWLAENMTPEKVRNRVRTFRLRHMKKMLEWDTRHPGMKNSDLDGLNGYSLDFEMSNDSSGRNNINKEEELFTELEKLFIPHEIQEKEKKLVNTRGSVVAKGDHFDVNTEKDHHGKEKTALSNPFKFDDSILHQSLRGAAAHRGLKMHIRDLKRSSYQDLLKQNTIAMNHLSNSARVDERSWVERKSFSWACNRIVPLVELRNIDEVIEHHGDAVLHQKTGMSAGPLTKSKVKEALRDRNRHNLLHNPLKIHLRSQYVGGDVKRISKELQGARGVKGAYPNYAQMDPWGIELY